MRFLSKNATQRSEPTLFGVNFACLWIKEQSCIRIRIRASRVSMPIACPRNDDFRLPNN
jgi:hypothetical protein